MKTQWQQFSNNNNNNNNNNNILYLNTVGFKAQSLWGREQIKFNQMQVFEERGKPGKTSQSREDNQQTQNTYDAESGNRT